MREGGQIPDRIANRPRLILGLELYFLAWFDLDSERSIGNALGPIPRSKIAEYADEYHLTPEQKEDMIYLVRELDNDFLVRQAKKKPKPSDGKENAQGSGG
jgi:hypothetical protein